MGCPYNVLLAEVDTWAGIWHGDGASPAEHAKAMQILNEALRIDPQPLEPLVGGNIAEAAKCFKKRTATPDGWHPRTFGLLSEESQDRLARVLNICECFGAWPEDESSIHMSIQRKPGGGKRLIGWYRALFRMWCMCRAYLWKEWEEK